ncbi:pyridoxamine 5'-phosphate oxidase family protein [Spongiactinospora sp. TRM90649]|uniref:pyridoxamine 5'-phosphate oxidase family protein n=1 Tax=Spongiactinospora sp. TRM90649 TaxID=3031114 RepID=UPI0023F8AFBA|nr:pyridoxamine 5'-phosphate oxidase family protein [Spongiactinospora sp. TRM90649]MDF5758058.1 pyridoxamine 5'-phosphate oxidase family protein [Spongiactinospora sp. TRM90649]
MEFELAVRLLRSNPYGFLTTVGADGRPNSRLVEHLAVDDDATVWIGTSPRSRKVADIRRRPDVTYAVEDRSAFAYVSLAARAEPVEDLAERVARWSPGHEAFFPGGPSGDDYVLIRLRPVRVEVMDFTNRVHPDPYGLMPASVELGGAGA